MKTRILILFLFLLHVNLLSGEEKKPEDPKNSSSGKFGLGITLFGPTGLTGKYLIDDKKSVEGSIGFISFGDNGRFHAHAVFLLNLNSFSENWNFYGGVGGVFEKRTYETNEKIGKLIFQREEYENSFGARTPLGLSWFSPDKKFEFSGEVYLNLFLLGRTGADLGLSFAGRYYF